MTRVDGPTPPAPLDEAAARPPTLGAVELASAGDHSRRGAWRVASPGEKLEVRARLPGAFSYDQATHGFRVARARGVPAAELLPAAFATSWLVNARTPSPVFKAWLEPPRRDAWAALLDATSVGPHGWRALSEGDREAVFAVVSGLSSHETRIAAISKVLACLSPETVPLMDDHALVMALGPVVSEPTDADHPVAGALHFVPMMDWFTRAVTDHESELVELARRHRAATLDAAQVLDRLLWFDSWGWRLTHRMPGLRYWLVREGEREAVVGIDAPAPSWASVGPIDLTTIDAETTFGSAARRALDAALGSRP